jgi:methionine S-methyltransferase
LQRKEARQFLHELQTYLQCYEKDTNVLNTYNFSIDDICISGTPDDENAEKLTLLQLPSIFSPEEWSFTFFEGLSRYPLSAFRGKVLTELGSGNGWISIALARKYMPAKIYGLDINPRAQVCGRINLFLNSLDASGAPVFDEEGKTVIDRVEFHTSDLLGYCLDNHIILDCIVGCIPQVLNPDENAIETIVQESASDEYLYDLSNYCGKQGYIEDQFGLGLIARTLEEALDCLSPSGKIVLNMGGRPGSAVLDRLFQRRGFQIKKVWHRKILQAGDTDISPLVQIEKKSPHRFEFYMGLNGNEPISAQTAQYYAQSGGQIAHSLTVYECTLERHAEIRKIFNLLKDEQFTEAKSALDLHFKDDSQAEEKINFLSALAENILKTAFIPYEDTEGEAIFRKRIAEYLRSYFHLPLGAASIFVAPNIASIVRNFYRIYAPEMTLCDKDFIRDLEKMPDTVLLEAPRNAHLLLELIEKLKPKAVIAKLEDFQYKTPDAFIRLLETTEKTGARLLLDISSHFELSSLPAPNGVLQYISEKQLPPHATVFCGFIQNKIYADLETAFLISENADFIAYMSAAAEFTYSRTPYFAQNYYSELIFDLLKFQIPNVRQQAAHFRNLSGEDDVTRKVFVQPTQDAQKAFAHPCITASHLPINAQTVRLDYGENELPAPTELKLRIFEAFARQNITPEEYQLDSEVKKLLENRFGLPSKTQGYLIYGSGVAPLFAAIAEFCAKNNLPMIFPTGCYGYFYATAQFFGVKVIDLPTQKENSFKISAETLSEFAEKYPGAYLFLNLPIVNPTGAIYDENEIAALAAASERLNVVIDTIFSGLAHHPEVETAGLEVFFEREKTDVVILGGFSKEFAAGGLRFGYAYMRNDELQINLSQLLRTQPHYTVKFAAKKLFADYFRQEKNFRADLVFQQSILKKRAEKLTEVLRQTGWEVLSPSGGLFMVASPRLYVGKKIKITVENREVTYDLTAANLPEALFYATGVLINNDVWTGIPEFCRFVLSVAEDDFQRALSGLRSFWDKYGN